MITMGERRQQIVDRAVEQSEQALWNAFVVVQSEHSHERREGEFYDPINLVLLGPETIANINPISRYFCDILCVFEYHGALWNA